MLQTYHIAIKYLQIFDLRKKQCQNVLPLGCRLQVAVALDPRKQSLQSEARGGDHTPSAAQQSTGAVEDVEAGRLGTSATDVLSDVGASFPT